MSLDERTRRRLSALANEDAREVTAPGREALLAQLRRDGPAVVRRAIFVRRAVRAGGAVSTLGLVAALASVWALRTPVEPRPCEAWASEGPPPSFVRDAGGSALHLDRATLLAAEGSSLRVQELSACRLGISLASGSVMVHAKDLGGGELWVVTQEGTVTVHGTVFNVEARPDAVVVEVAEGVVEVSGGEEPPAMVRQGERMRRGRKIDERAVLAGERAEQILRTLGVVGARAEELGAQAAALREAGAAKPEPALDLDEADERPRAARPHRREAVGPGSRRVRRAHTPPPREEPLVPIAPQPGATPAVPRAVAPSNRAVIPSMAPAPRLDPESLVRQGEASKRAGDLAAARAAFRAAGALSGSTAEAAWISLARLELEVKDWDAARGALAARQRSFGDGLLGPEATWLAVEVEEADGNTDRAQAAAKLLIGRWPKTPQAKEAQRWLDKQGH